MGEEQEQERQEEMTAPSTVPSSTEPSASSSVWSGPGIFGNWREEMEEANERMLGFLRRCRETEQANIESAPTESTKDHAQPVGEREGETAMEHSPEGEEDVGNGDGETDEEFPVLEEEEEKASVCTITPSPAQQQAETINAEASLFLGARGQPPPQISIANSGCAGMEGAGEGEESRLQSQIQAVVEGWCGPRMKALAREVSRLKEANERQAEEIARLKEMLGTTGTTLQREKVRVDVIDQRTEREVVERARIEDGWRKNNIRLVGLPEKLEEQDLTAYVRGNITKWAPNLKNKQPDIVHASRVGAEGQGNNKGPRTVVVQLQSYQDRADILRETRQRTTEGRGRPPILFFPDFSPYTAAKRRALNPAMKRAKELGLDPFLKYPHNLLLGETRTPCSTPEEAETFIKQHELSTTSILLAPPPSTAHTHHL